MLKRRHTALTDRADTVAKKPHAETRIDWGEESEDDELALKSVEEVEKLGRGLLRDVLGCVRRLRERFQATCPYFVSKTLVYEALVGGLEEGDDPGGACSNTVTATDVDVGLEELKQMGMLTAIYVPSVGDEGLVETDEYREIVQRVLRQGGEGTPNDRLREAGQYFHDKIVGEYHGPTFQLPKGSASTGYLDVLVKHELILRMPGGRNTTGVDTFAFKVPGSGGVLSSMLGGRHELVARIKRKRHREMLVSKIRKEVKLKKSALGIEWHVADLVGSGLVHVTKTTVGPILRVIDN